MRTQQIGAFIGSACLSLFLSAPSYARESYLPKPYLGTHLVGHVPDGWKAASSSVSEFIETVTYLPQEQTPENWEEMVTIYTPTIAPNRPKFENEKPEDILRGLLQSITPKAKDHCDGHRTGKIVPIVQNNYLAAGTAQYCGKDDRTEKGEITTFKVITDKKDFVIGTRAWRLPPFNVDTFVMPQEKSKELLGWANNFILCNKSDPSRPCPPGR